MNKLHRLFNFAFFLAFCALITVAFIQNCYASDSHSTAASSAENCFNSAKTQLELDQCAGIDLGNSKASFDALYNKLLSIYANNTSFTKKLKISQSAWVEFTQMQLLMKYPHSGEQNYYGSVYPMCGAEYLSSLYSQRVQSLSPIAMQLQYAIYGSLAKQASATLKDMYRIIISKYSDDKLFISAFQAANTAWLDYQKAQLTAMFPQSSTKLFDGTSMNANDYLGALEMQRITELRDWTSGIEEGDVCSGSVKTPEELSLGSQ